MLACSSCANCSAEQERKCDLWPALHILTVIDMKACQMYMITVEEIRRLTYLVCDGHVSLPTVLHDHSRKVQKAYISCL